MAALRASGVRAAVLLRPGLARPPPSAGYHEKVGQAGEGRRETVRRPRRTTTPSVPITGVAAPPLESAELSKDGLQNAGPGKADTRQARGWWEGSEDPRLGLMGREGDGGIPSREAGGREGAPGAVRFPPPSWALFPLVPPLPGKQQSPFGEIEAPRHWLGLIAGSWAERGEPKSPDALQSLSLASSRSDLGAKF